MVRHRFRLMVAGVALLFASPAMAQQYTVTDLGTRGSCSDGAGINANGQVVGTTWGADVHAFIWTKGALQDLGLLPGTLSCRAQAINDHGQVVGWCQGSAGLVEAFLWTADAGMTAVDIPHRSAAYGINNHGDIVGIWNPSDDRVTWDGFVYRDGDVEDLGEGDARAINDRGQIVGSRRPDPYSAYAVLWDEEGRHDLEDPEGSGSVALAISASGLVAGHALRPSVADQHAVLWTPYGLSDLGTLEGSRYGSWAFAISGDLIVGTSSSSIDRSDHAFLYDINGPGYPVDLNDLIPADSGLVLQSAIGVNAVGQIVACGSASRTFLLTPVPSTMPR
jgi:probable HAF family extracellular repeat protein